MAWREVDYEHLSLAMDRLTALTEGVVHLPGDFQHPVSYVVHDGNRGPYPVRVLFSEAHHIQFGTRLEPIDFVNMPPRAALLRHLRRLGPAIEFRAIDA
jgi:hypothetical protein